MKTSKKHIQKIYQKDFDVIDKFFFCLINDRNKGKDVKSKKTIVKKFIETLFHLILYIYAFSNLHNKDHHNLLNLQFS